MKTYIPLESDILLNDRMNKLLNKMGMEGYGIFFTLLVELRNHENYCINSETLKVICRKNDISQTAMNQFLFDFDLFTIEYISEDTFIVSSEYVKRVMQSYDNKIEKCRAAGKKSAERRKTDKNEGALESVATTEKNRTEKKRTEQNKTTTTTNKAKSTDVVVDAAVVDDDDVDDDVNDIAVNAPAVNGVAANAAAADDAVDDDDITSGNNEWKKYLARAIKDKSWLKCHEKHSGLGALFKQYQPQIIEWFTEHAITHGKEPELTSVSKVKCYFANFVRKDTATAKRITESIQELERQRIELNPYRFETIDEATGKRMAQGFPIPSEAPPRPNREAVWSYEMKRWM